MPSPAAMDILHRIASGETTVTIPMHNEFDTGHKEVIPVIAASDMTKAMPVTVAWHIDQNGLSHHDRASFMSLKGSEAGRHGFWIVCAGDVNSLQEDGLWELARTVSEALNEGPIRDGTIAGLIAVLAKITCQNHDLAYVAPEGLERPVQGQKNVVALTSMGPVPALT